jgi:hypothetical protein
MNQPSPQPGTDALDHSTAAAVIDLMIGAWRAQAISAGVALGLPDHVAAGCTTLGQLAAASGAGEDGLRRLMRLLVSERVFSGGESGYLLTPIGHRLRRDVPGSMRDLCLIYGDEFYRAWGAAADALRTGRPGFDHVFGQTLHEYLRERADATSTFQGAMSAGSTFFADVPRAFDFSDRVVVDVGGGNGMLLSAILGAHGTARGVLLDLPHVTEPVRARGLERCEIVSGDLFQSVPGGGDVYLLCRVLQDWDDDRCIALLRNCSAVMRPDSRLLILERVVPEDGSASLALYWDLHLLMVAGGRERTIPEYKVVLEACGLALESIAALPLEMSMLVVRCA